VEPQIRFCGSWNLEVISVAPGIGIKLGVSYVLDNGGGGIIPFSVGPGFKTQYDWLSWSFSLDYAPAGSSTWQSMHLRRTSVDFTPIQGLVVNLGAARDQNFSDVVLQCISLDPQVTAFIPVTTIPNFTYPERAKIG
jgi:hypothetical protein